MDYWLHVFACYVPITVFKVVEAFRFRQAQRGRRRRLRVRPGTRNEAQTTRGPSILIFGMNDD